jgi:hypothetical protein
MTLRRNPALAAAATCTCLLAMAALGWAAAGPWGLLLPLLIAATGLQQPEGHLHHPNRTSAALWQTLPLAVVATVPFLAVALVGGAAHHALPAAMAAVFALSVAIGQAREHLFQWAMGVGGLAASAFVLWVLAVGLTSSAAPQPFAVWRESVDTYGPWIFAGGILSIASLVQLIVLGRWHIHHRNTAPDTIRHVRLGAFLGGLTGMVVGLCDPFPSPAPVWLWICTGMATGAISYLLDAQHNRWLVLMAWSLPKPNATELVRWRVETAIALGDALGALHVEPKGWELAWDWDERRESPAIGVPLRFDLRRHAHHPNGVQDAISEVLQNAYKRFDERYGRSVRPGEDTGVSPIQQLSAHAKMAAMAQVAQTS